MELLIGLIVGHVALALGAALWFKKSFGGSVLWPLVISILLTGIPILLLTSLLMVKKSGLRDSWRPIEYKIPNQSISLPDFEAPRVSDYEEYISLASKLASKETEIQQRVYEFAKKTNRRAGSTAADQRAANKEIYEFSEKQALDLNYWVRKNVTDYYERGILGETIGRDDHIDLNKLRVPAEPMAFFSPNSKPYEAPPALSLRKQPTLAGQELPKVSSILPPPLKRTIAESFLRADLEAWNSERDQLDERNQQLVNDHKAAEEARKGRLATHELEYKDARETYVRLASAHNSKIDMTTQAFSLGEKNAVEEYALTVLGAGNYPPEIDPKFVLDFDEQGQELQIQISLPHPKFIEKTVATYKLVKSKKEIVPGPPKKTDIKRLYSSVVAQLMIRAAHEVAEADREGVIASIAVLGMRKDMMSNSSVPIAALAGISSNFDEKALKGDPLVLFKELGGTLSKDPVEGVQIILKGSIRGG